MTRSRRAHWALAVLATVVATVVAVLAGRSPAGSATAAGTAGTTSGPPASVRAPASPVTSPASAAPGSAAPGSAALTSAAPGSAAPASAAAPTSGAPTTPPPPPSPTPASGPRPADLDIPSIGVRDLRVLPYKGTTDDRAGTRIQDRGLAASPYGPRGGVGPGDVGNYLVTAHRLSAGGPLHDLPALEVGAKVLVTADGTVYEYTVTETRTTSFRSTRSLAEQRAAVPGAPDRKPTRPMITLSTCATPEDNAAGNLWRDAQGNPEHRIDKIGVLTAVRAEPAGR
ncbi:class E sortase [Streptomyces sp. NPDC053493]|uniref:class E sortase n=1 Tax=Streptomyces sp. NPDC053493 TaxID=3365705 RepID=UPI0037D68B45